MKTLHLLRHAKSSWDGDTSDDHARPLAPRGRRNAKAMGRFLAKRGIAPDRVRCSTARRAVETWERVAPSLDENVEQILDDSLYMADSEELFELIRSEDDSVSSLLLVGHNPGLADLALLLCGDGPPDELRQIAGKFPTGAWVEIALECGTWRDIQPASGRLRGLQIPRAL